MEKSVKSISISNLAITECLIVKVCSGYRFKSGSVTWSWCFITLYFQLLQAYWVTLQAYKSIRSASASTASNTVAKNTYCKLSPMGHSVSNQQEILDHYSDFDKTWCVCSTYGTHHPYQLLTTYIT